MPTRVEDRTHPNMIGILGYAGYVPSFRLTRSEVSRAWGRPPPSPQGDGERAVANADEDSLTVAAEAAFRCLRVADGHPPDGVYFASTTAPDHERSVAAVIAAAADLPRAIRTADLTGSLKAGTTALLAGLDAVKGGPAWSVLIASGDCRLAEPGASAEAFIGDGGAAFLVGEGDALATVEAACSVAEDFPGTWRPGRDRFFRSDDETFAAQYGYHRTVLEAMRRLLDRAKIDPQRLSSVICPSPDPAAYAAVAKASGVPSLFFDEPLARSVGFAGAASPLLHLARCLDRAEPGQLILMLGYGNGADAILLSVTDRIDAHRPRASRDLLAGGQPLPSYLTYLQYRDLLRRHDGPRGGEPFTSLTMLWRERTQNLALYGARCLKCEAAVFPVRRVCPSCATRDAFEPLKLARRGRIVTFTTDRLFPGPTSPTVMAVVDLEGGGRLFTQMTDCGSGAIRIGMAVDLVLRRFHEAKGYVHYFWKAKPA
jgi:3-hydroxy-3-methylglutaryl CoA synthase